MHVVINSTECSHGPFTYIPMHTVSQPGEFYNQFIIHTWRTIVFIKSCIWGHAYHYLYYIVRAEWYAPWPNASYKANMAINNMSRKCILFYMRHYTILCLFWTWSPYLNLQWRSPLMLTTSTTFMFHDSLWHHNGSWHW